VVGDSPDEKRQPAIVIKGKASKRYLMPSRAHLMVQDGDTASPGDVLAKIPRETTKTKDITGGLPRVVDCSKPASRMKPRSSAEIDGTVKFGEVSKGQRKIYVVARQRHRKGILGSAWRSHQQCRKANGVKARPNL